MRILALSLFIFLLAACAKNNRSGGGANATPEANDGLTISSQSWCKAQKEGYLGTEEVTRFHFLKDKKLQVERMVFTPDGEELEVFPALSTDKTWKSVGEPTSEEMFVELQNFDPKNRAWLESSAKEIFVNLRASKEPKKQLVISAKGFLDSKKTESVLFPCTSFPEFIVAEPVNRLRVEMELRREHFIAQLADKRLPYPIKAPLENDKPSEEVIVGSHWCNVSELGDEIRVSVLRFTPDHQIKNVVLSAKLLVVGPLEAKDIPNSPRPDDIRSKKWKYENGKLKLEFEKNEMSFPDNLVTFYKDLSKRALTLTHGADSAVTLKNLYVNCDSFKGENGYYFYDHSWHPKSEESPFGI